MDGTSGDPIACILSYNLFFSFSFSFFFFFILATFLHIKLPACTLVVWNYPLRGHYCSPFFLSQSWRKTVRKRAAPVLQVRVIYRVLREETSHPASLWNCSVPFENVSSKRCLEIQASYDSFSEFDDDWCLVERERTMSLMGVSFSLVSCCTEIDEK